MWRWVLHSKPINSAQVLSYMQVEIVTLKLTLPVMDLKEFGGIFKFTPIKAKHSLSKEKTRMCSHTFRCNLQFYLYMFLGQRRVGLFIFKSLQEILTPSVHEFPVEKQLQSTCFSASGSRLTRQGQWARRGSLRLILLVQMSLRKNLIKRRELTLGIQNHGVRAQSTKWP